MTNTHYPLQNPAAVSSVPLANSLDASRGAGQFGISSRVMVHHDVLDNYGELDPAMGRNVIGAVLAVIGYHLDNGLSFADTEVLPVCLRRREDGQPVEVELRVRRLRHSGRECLAVTPAGERPTEL